MKLLIASDIHGSALFCGQLMEAYKKEGTQRLLLLGDLLYHGPRNELPQGYAPKEVIRMLNEKSGDILCVRGNCEAEVDQMVLDFPVMADYSAIFLDGITAVSYTHLVCAMIKEGYTSKEIADALFITKKTVDYHRSSIRKKLDLKNGNLRVYLETHL